ncbi:MAG TPA: hypothetical protein VEY89_12105, partial [Candidatus Dormibacteraeota bacterium]|nr:hypothetical protein [Candidatus Dormibacteraeota bacterium]
MPMLVQARTDDEIADVIEKVRAAKDPEVGLVLPRGSRALQTPLNARLLSQFSRREGRRTAIVSDEPRVQELARASGFPVYASVAAFERGIELGAVMAGAGAASRATGARTAGTAVQEPPSRVATQFAPPPPAATATHPEMRRPLPPGPPAPSRWRDRRRPLYFAAGAAAVIGLLLFFTLAPSAKITVTLAGTQLSKNATIQGSTDPTAARQGDHVLTTVLTAQAAGSFQATPTGTAQLPPTPATATLTFSWNGPAPQVVYMPQGQVFETGSQSVSFVSSQTTTLCLGPNGHPATQSDCGSVTPNNQLAVQDGTAEAKGNVPANTITAWPQDPCSPSNYDVGQCQGPGHDFHVTNASAATGGADAKQVTVASSSDVDGWNTQLAQIENTLTNQVNSQMQGMASGKKFAVDPGGGGKAIRFKVSANLPIPGDQFSAST